MAVSKTSSRSEIRTYQKELNDAGANPPLVVDGIWGPKTQGAHDASVKDEATGTTGGLVGTGPEDTEPRFGLAGGAELWKNTTTGESFIVYVVPGTEGDPVYMRWLVGSDEDVQSFFGPGQPVVYQQSYNDTDKIWGETLDFGSSDDISNTSKSPFDSWASTLATESESQPWLLDDDYQELLAMSIIEGRPLTVGETRTTNWWKEHNEAERQWMEDYSGDPSQAQQNIKDGRLAQAEYMRAAGMADLDDRLVNYMADKVTKGEWSSAEMEQQIRILSDPYFSQEPLDQDFQNWVDDNAIEWDITHDKETEVRNLVSRWLGSNFGNWDDETVNSWAGRLRNEGDAPEALIETLKDQRLALFPEYDREADYQTIAAPWRNMMRNAWGEVPDDSDIALQSIIRMNDAGEAGSYLTKEGLARGNTNTVNSVQTAMTNSFGGM